MHSSHCLSLYCPRSLKSEAPLSKVKVPRKVMFLHRLRAIPPPLLSYISWRRETNSRVIVTREARIESNWMSPKRHSQSAGRRYDEPVVPASVGSVLSCIATSARSASTIFCAALACSRLRSDAAMGAVGAAAGWECDVGPVTGIGRPWGRPSAPGRWVKSMFPGAGGKSFWDSISFDWRLMI